MILSLGLRGHPTNALVFDEFLLLQL